MVARQVGKILTCQGNRDRNFLTIIIGKGFAVGYNTEAVAQCATLIALQQHQENRYLYD